MQVHIYKYFYGYILFYITYYLGDMNQSALNFISNIEYNSYPKRWNNFFYTLHFTLSLEYQNN